MENSLVKKVAKITTPVILVIIVYLVGMFGFIFPVIEESIYDFKKEKIQELVNSTSKVIEKIQEKEKSGELSQKQAQEMAINFIRDIRYGEAENEYYWICDKNDYMIMHPYVTELDGKYVGNIRDNNGIFLFKEFSKTVKESKEGGFVSYLWQRHADSEDIRSKISFVKETSWGWILGTGVYIDDVKIKVAKIQGDLITISSIVIICILIILLYTNMQSYKISKQQHELKRNHDELADLNDMKNKLFSIIAHDLRTPVGIIYSLAESLNLELKKENLKNPEIKDQSERIFFSSKNILVFIEALFQWAQLQARTLKMNQQEFQVEEIIDESFTLLEEIANQKQIILNKKGDLDISLIADKNMLATVIRNLTSNAIKFTKPHGQVTIDVDKSDDKVSIYVMDNGIGMSQDALSHLFVEKVSTLGTNNEVGSGLGLVVCKDFITSMGGNLYVDSQIGVGSKFTIEIPI